MAKKKRKERAVAGTKLDPTREQREVSELDRAKKAFTVEPGRKAPWMNSAREKLASRIFVMVEVVLVAVPFAFLAMTGALNMSSSSVTSLQDAMKADPSITITFIVACLQCLVVYLLHIAYRHYTEGDAGYAMANFIVLACGEMLVQNYAGAVGIGMLMWRCWKRSSDQMGAWWSRRGLGGALVDMSGSLVVLALEIVCFVANMRLS